jgi:hypothetical protein
VPPFLPSACCCSACAKSYYVADDGTCAACPPRLTAWQQYQGLLYIGVAVVAIVILVYAFLAVIVCVQGGTITGGLFRMSNLALWALSTAQVCRNKRLL